MAYETFLFEEDQPERQEGRIGKRRHPWPLLRRRRREEREGKDERKDENIIDGFYRSGSNLIEEEEAERTVEKSLMQRLKENPFTWYDYLIFLIEAGLFILLILALLGRIPLF